MFAGGNPVNHMSAYCRQQANMPELAPWQDAFATTGPAFMATVRQSITALYEEAQRSAVAGAPMLAVLQSDAAGTDRLTDRTDTDNTIPVPATAIAMRFDELRRLADLEAGSRPSELPAGPETPADVPNDPFAGIDLSAGFGGAPHILQNDTADAITANESGNDAGNDEVVAPGMDEHANMPVIDIPVTGFGAAPEDTGEPGLEEPDDAAPVAQATIETGSETGTALPEEPPAPASNNMGDDLDIADIHTLVREAWEDETALGEIASHQAVEHQAAEHQEVEHQVAEPETARQDANGHAEAADLTAVGNIETAMQEIAAAVVQSADSSQTIDVETMKREIIAAMRTELQAVVDSDLKSVIKTAVAEAMADMPAVAPPARQAAKRAPKAAQKAAQKASAKKAAKGAVRAAAKKKAPPKAGAKTGNGKAVDDSES